MNSQPGRVYTQNINQWLNSIGMSQYADLFQENDIEINQLLSMTEADFEKIGIRSMGHRKLLLEAKQNILLSVQSDNQLQIQAESRKLLIIVLKGYLYVAILAAIILQFTLKEKLITDIGFFDGLILAAILLVFMIPSIVAFWRGVEYRYAILLGNVFLGGTGLGWFVCLFFAFEKINPAAAAVMAFFSTKQKK